jgi:hypothetical protein
MISFWITCSLRGFEPSTINSSSELFLPAQDYSTHKIPQSHCLMKSCHCEVVVFCQNRPVAVNCMHP